MKGSVTCHKCNTQFPGGEDLENHDCHPVDASASYIAGGTGLSGCTHEKNGWCYCPAKPRTYPDCEHLIVTPHHALACGKAL
jgi:hypothetical protein